MPAQKKAAASDLADGQLAAQALKPTDEKPKMMLEPEVSEPVVTPAPSGTAVIEPPQIPVTVGDLAKVDSVPPSPGMPIQVEKAERSGGGWGWLWVVVAFAIGLSLGGAGGYMMWGGGNLKLPGSKSVTPEVTTQPSIVPTVVPTNIPTVQLNRKDLNLEVLNGSGVAGAASKAKDYLTGLGYVNVTAGNADTSDFAKTEIAIKPAKKAYLDMLTKDLTAGGYTVDNKTSDLAADSQYDAVVTLGK